MTVHVLKIMSSMFEAVAFGAKPFEIRFNDRDYHVGDVLRLREYGERWDGGYSGREIERRVSYVLTTFAGLQHGYVIMGLEDAL